MTGEIEEERARYLALALAQARAGRSLLARLEPREGLDAEGLLAEDAERLLSELAGRGVRALTLADSGYPRRLREVPDPPPALFVDGSLPAALIGDGPAVAVVGSRRASAGALATARTLGRALAERGVCVVSGLALGVDGAAHAGALEGGGPTVGVLGCGIDVVYPRVHRELFGRVRQRGALASEYSLGEAPLAWRFPARNRIIAGLCDAVVVVEAGEKSGALITARHALESGREVWAVPGPVGAEGCRGTNRLLADGAAVLWDVPEFLAAVTSGGPGEVRDAEAPRAEPVVPAGLPEIEAAVLGGLGSGPADVDRVAECTGVEMPALLPALVLLELKGYVARGRDGTYVRRGLS